jgi:antagonist of KipI
MPRVKILKSGLMTSIQDNGRIGLSYYAIPNSGYMLTPKAELANFLVGNKKHEPILECTLIPPRLEFLDDTCLSITGDDFNFMIDDTKVDLNKTIYVKKGAVLKGSPQKNAHLAYIAFQGKINGQNHYGSQSTYDKAKLGGIDGMFLKQNDIITIVNKNLSQINREIKENKAVKREQLIHFNKGPEFKYLDNKSIDILFNSEFRIGSNSNRMGARLDGPRLNTTSNQLKQSVPVLPGFIQLPPSGQLIIVLKDGQTTGGYPRIGYINSDDMEKIIGIGKSIIFKE